MNRTLSVPVLLTVLLWTASSGLVQGQRADPRRKIAAPARTAPETPPWTGLSARALVTHPAAIPGVTAWTIESRRHRGGIICMSLSPDGKQLVTGGIDGTIRVWDAETGKCVRALLGHDSYVYGLAWSPNSSKVASAGSFDGTVRVWDVESGKAISVDTGFKEYAYHVAWSPDGNSLMASGGSSGWIWLSAGSKKASVAMEVGRHVYHLAWSPDGNYVAACALQSSVSIIDPSAKKTIRTFGAASEAFISADWSPDSRFLAGAGAGGVTVWDLKEQEEKAVVKIPGSFASVAWSPDGKRLVTAASSTALVQIWDVASGKAVGTVTGSASKVFWHPKSQQILSMSSVHFAVFDPAAGKQLRSVDAGGLTPPVWTAGRPLVSGLGTTTLSLWDANTTKFISRLEGHTAAVSAVSWARDGNTLASASYDKTVRLWNAKAGEASETLNGHTAAVTTVAWASDGKTLASAGADNTVMLWSAKGQNLAKLEGHTAPVTALAWSRTSNLLASGGSDSSILLWDANKKRRTRMIQAFQPVLSLAWASMDRTPVLACGTADDTVRIFNIATGAQVGSLQQAGSPPSIASVCWLPDPGTLLAGRSCHIVQVWDVEASKVVRSLSTMAPVQYVTWGANGSIFVSGNSERTVRFWDGASGLPRGVLIEEKDYVAMIAADGTWRWDANVKPDLAFVVQTGDLQTTLTPEEFTARYSGKGKSRAKSSARN